MLVNRVCYSLETALEEEPREKWATSHKVSAALLGCTRIKNIVRQHMSKRGVKLTYFNDVLTDIAVVMQMKMVDKLEKPKDVYFVLFRVSQLVVSNFGKKSVQTDFSEEVDFSSLAYREDEQEALLERMFTEGLYGEGKSETAATMIDKASGKKRFLEKVNTLGWPEEIPKTRQVLGRPPKAGTQAIPKE